MRDTFVKPWRGAGQGIVVIAATRAAAPVAVTLEQLLLARAMSVGVYIEGGNVELLRSLVRDVVADADGQFGDGAAAQPLGMVAGTLRVNGSTLSGNARAAIVVWHGDATVAGSSLSCNAFDLELGGEVDPRLTAPKIVDEGENRCGCEKPGSCRVSSSGLAPYSAAPTP